MKALKYIAGICLALSHHNHVMNYLTQTSPDKLTSDSYWRDKAERRVGNVISLFPTVFCRIFRRPMGFL